MFRQAIVTKFHGPTNTKGSRVSARCEAKRILVSWDHRLHSDGNHVAAAKALASQLGWEGPWYGGCIDGGYTFVQGGDDDLGTGCAFRVEYDKWAGWPKPSLCAGGYHD
jgi:hypothetical protein